MSLRRLAVVLPLALVACPPGQDSPRPVDGALVVGLQSDELGSLVGSVHVVVTQDGAVVRDETLPASPAPLPRELTLTGPPGARIEVRAEALPVAGGAPPLVSRLAAAPLVASGKKLLRVYLESRCVAIPGASGPSCDAPLTCIAGGCASGDVPGDALEDYEPGWAAAPPDICRPARHGPPEVRIGTGQTDYANLDEGQVLRLEKGPQGGHHVWIAARMRNLRQSGSTIALRAAIEGDPQPVPPVAYVFTFEPDEGSFCKVWGLRYQVDAGVADLGSGYRRFLGKRVTITVEVKDSTGASASSTKTVQLADKLLCPDGTEACNTP